jgi:phosphatidylserine/phosphatidylglycerophosphate/cardiolipin synthase-like enzyme
MANTGVTGSVRDELRNPIEGVTVAAWDVDGLFSDTLLGKVETDAAGNFAIHYPAGAYGLEANPDIVVRVYNAAKWVILTTPVAEDVSAAMLVIPPITVRRDMLSGFAVTLGKPTPQMMATGNTVEYLVDNEVAWTRLTESLLAATTSIYISQLTIDIVPTTPGKVRLYIRFQGATPQTTDDRLEKILVAAAARGVEVLLLINDFRMFWGIPGLEEVVEFPNYPADTSSRLNDYFKNLGVVSKVQYRRFRMPLLNPMHAKLAVIDGREAFTIGSPFLQEYFDDTAHRLDNPKRGSFEFINQMTVPIHDVSCRVRGPIVSELTSAFLLHWNQADPNSPQVIAGPVPPPEPTSQNMQVTRSLRGEHRFKEVPGGEAGILESYLRAVAAAENFIYLEDQYFTCQELCDGLALALQRKPNLRVILLANSKVDLPVYGIWQDSFFNRLLEVAGSPPTGRLGIFTLWTHSGDAPPLIIRNYVHSKVSIIDDRWATVGSANCDGASLSAGEHIGLLSFILLGIPSVANVITGGDWNFRNQRSSEVNIAIFNEDGSFCPNAESLRRRLWAEHLGFLDQGQPNPLDPRLAAPLDGQLALKLWNDIAQGKQDKLKTDAAHPTPPRILPYPLKDGKVRYSASDAATYLKYLETDLTKVSVLTKTHPFPLPS